MKTNYIKLAALILTLFVLTGGVSFAQESNVQNALKETKDSVNELVEAKDEDSPFDVVLRIKTFKKVVDLSTTEAKDLKIQLISIDNFENDRLNKWRSEVVEKLNNITTHYENTKQNVEDSEVSLKLEDVQNIATEFKKWRDKNYIPIQTEIQDFLLIKKEEGALQISNKRLEKVRRDVGILEKAGVNEIEKLKEMLSNAESLIKNAEKENKEALSLFVEIYTAPLITKNATSTDTEKATSTEESSTSTIKVATSTEEELSEVEVETEPATTTKEAVSVSTSTPESEMPEVEKKSIRDLVRSSWINIKGAYQTFIDMSGFVRKLLQ